MITFIVDKCGEGVGEQNGRYGSAKYRTNNQRFILQGNILGVERKE